MEKFVKSKIKSVEELSKIVEKLKKEGKKVVQCHGDFDLVHPGHIYHFEAAKKYAEVLVVSVTADEFVKKGPGRPFFPDHIRVKNLANFHLVDYVVVNKDFSAIKILKKIKPNVYFKGQEYEVALKDPSRNLYKEAKAVKSVGGEIKFSYEQTFSSTKMFKNCFDAYPEETKKFLEDFGKNYGSKDVIDFLKGVEDLRVLVIGETIIDEYNYVRPMGKIPKDNLIATQYLNQEVFAGGVLATTNHIANFCRNVDLVTVLGKKSDYEDFVKNNLQKNVRLKLFLEKDGETIVKKRFIDKTFFSKMFEIYHFDDKDISSGTSKKIVKHLIKMLPTYDVVIVNDYGHGFFTDEIIETLIKNSKYLAVNTQTNSANFGFNLITKYKKADYVCIDEPEARLATHAKSVDIKNVMNKISQKVKFQKMVVTQGHLGSIATSRQGNYSKAPVFSTNVVDRVGAGDAFLAITSLLAVRKAPIEILSFVGNAVGSLQIAIVGNKKSVDSTSLYKFIQTLLK